MKISFLIGLCGLVATATASTTSELLKLVLPGSTDHGELTKHCFAEPNTVNDGDLGNYKSTDMCCMTHNKCSMLGPNKLRDCNCEEDFRACLKANKPSPGESIFRAKYGKNYFNIVYPKCTRQGGSFTCVSKISDENTGEERCGDYKLTSGTEHLSLDNKFYETL